MGPSKEQSISITEFANRYNETRPLGKDFMPLEPSYVKFLCEQGHIRHSKLPAHDGRKKETIMIPESELDTVDILLNGDEAVEVEPVETKPVEDESKERELLTSKEAAEILGVGVTYISTLGKTNQLKRTRIHGCGRGLHYGYNKEDVLRFKAEREQKIELKKSGQSDEVIKLKKYISELEKKNKQLTFENSDLRDRLNHSTSEDKDIFEAYRHGFKDGFEMRGKE
jgi:regulator of replication initiation timing